MKKEKRERVPGEIRDKAVREEYAKYGYLETAVKGSADWDSMGLGRYRKTKQPMAE